MGIKKKKEVENRPLEGKLRSNLVLKLKELCEHGSALPVIKLLLKCIQIEGATEQLILVKQVLATIQKEICSSQVELSLHILTDIYFQSPTKNPLKRIVASSLQNLPDQQKAVAKQSLQDTLLEYLQIKNVPKVGVSQRLIVDGLVACLDGFGLGEECLGELWFEVLVFLHDAVDNFSKSALSSSSSVVAMERMHDCMAAIKVTVAVLQKTKVNMPENHNRIVRNLLSDIFQLAAQIIQNDAFILDCRNASGMCLPLLLKVLDKTNCIHLFLQVFYPLNLPNPHLFDLSIVLPTLSRELLTILSNLEPCGHLCLISGALAMFDSTELTQEYKPDHCLLTSIFNNQFRTIINSVSDSTTTVATSHGIVLWTLKAKSATIACPEKQFLKYQLQGDSTLCKELFNYIWTSWDHFIDIVRQQTKIIFGHMINIHLICTEEDPKKSKFLLDITKSLISLPWDQRGKYGCLCCLVEQLGAQTILDMCPNILSRLISFMGDQTLVPYMSELVELLFTSHKSELASFDATGSVLLWQQTWVIPVLDTLCCGTKRQQIHIVEHILPKLLKCCPETLEFVISALIKSTNGNTYTAHLGALMTFLKTAQGLGILKQITETGGDSKLWNGIVPVQIVKQGLCHLDDQVRLNSFGLLCDNLKTTELVPTLDLELLRFFLPLNLNNQSPAFRQQMISLLKKLLIRLRDGGNALVKQISQLRKSQIDADDELQQMQRHLDMYKNFLSWLSQLQFYSLLPEASFSRQTTVLSILATIDTVIGFNSDIGKNMSLSSCLTFSNLQSVLNCFTDSYETNKTVALSLLKRWPVDSVIFKDVKLIKDLWNASLDLASSIKPQDCTTAAYLLRLLIPRPPLLEIVKQTCKKLDQQQSAEISSYDVKLEYIQTDVHESSVTQKNKTINSTPDEQNITIDNSTQPCNSNGHLSKGDDSDEQLENASYAVVEVLFKILKRHLVIAQKNILVAAGTAPMYGILHCIRYILGDLELSSLHHPLLWKSYLASLIKSCFLIAKCVSGVVNNSSPEGHLPMDIEPEGVSEFCRLSLTEEEEDFDSSPGDESSLEQNRAVSSQKLLVCCWRSLKEVSLLLGLLSSTAPISHLSEEPGLLSCQQIFQIGEYFNGQLLESKHRGAFELAYAGFVLMCEKLWKSSIPKIHELPIKWLRDLLQDVRSCSEASRLCATRRSAGLPFLIQALVSSEPAVTGHCCFKYAMTELLIMALPGTHGDKPSQVHAFNILRALYKDTKLGEEIYPYVADGMKAAILGFTAKTWAVRNSATLLFSALITRIFGVKRSRDEQNKKNTMTGRTFFFRFPSLYSFLLGQLQEAAQHFNKLQLHPSLYPVLMVLARLFPSALEGYDSHLNTNAFVPYVIGCGKSPVMKIRVMAARALVPLVAADNTVAILEQLLGLLPHSENEAVDQNQVHGALLQIQHLLQESTNMPIKVCAILTESFLPELGQFFWLAKRCNPCLITRAAFLDVIETVLVPALHYPAQDCLMKQVFQLLLLDIVDLSVLSHHMPGATIFYATVVRFFFGLFQSNKELHKDLLPEDSKVIVSLLKCHHYEVRLATLKQLIVILRQNSDNTELFDAENSDGEKIFFTEENNYTPSEESIVLLHILLKEEVIHELVRMASGTEPMPECLTEVFNILSLILQKPNPKQVIGCPNTFPDYLKLLQLTNERRQSEKQDDLSCALHRCSASLLPFVYEELSQSTGRRISIKLALQDWCGLHLISISIEHSQPTRLVAAQALVQNAVLLLLDPQQLIGDMCFLMWRSLIQCLQDDDAKVKDVTSRTLLVLQTFKQQKPTTRLLHPVQASYALQESLRLLVEHHGNKRWKECVQTLLQWLQEEQSDSPSEADKIRLFDKGEMNTYIEEVTFYRHLGNCLNRLLHGTVPEISSKKTKPVENDNRPNGDCLSCDLNVSDDKKEWMTILKDLNLPTVAENCLDKLEEVINAYGVFTYKMAFVEVQKMQKTVIQLYKYAAIFDCLHRLSLPFTDLKKIEDKRLHLSKKMDYCYHNGLGNAFTVKIQSLLKPKPLQTSS